MHHEKTGAVCEGMVGGEKTKDKVNNEVREREREGGGAAYGHINVLDICYRHDAAGCHVLFVVVFCLPQT